MSVTHSAWQCSICTEVWRGAQLSKHSPSCLSSAPYEHITSEHGAGRGAELSQQDVATAGRFAAQAPFVSCAPPAEDKPQDCANRRRSRTAAAAQAEPGWVSTQHFSTPTPHCRTCNPTAPSRGANRTAAARGDPARDPCCSRVSHTHLNIISVRAPAELPHVNKGVLRTRQQLQGDSGEAVGTVG